MTQDRNVSSGSPNIVWVTRSFLDYRIPVYAALSNLVGGRLHVFFCADAVPERVRNKASEVLGSRAVGLTGEISFGSKDFSDTLANTQFRIPFQRGILKEIRRLKPDILIGDGLFQWTAPLLWLRIHERVPLVVCYERTAHTERNVQWFRRLYRKWAMGHVDAMCCSGKLSGDYARSLGMSAERMTFGHMAADVDGLQKKVAVISHEEKERLRTELDVHGTMMLYVGRLIKRKGLWELLRGWADAFVEIEMPVDLVVAGEGPEREDLERFCREKNLSRIHFVGAVPYDELPLYYASADLLVMPTLEDNWSLVVPEAMAAGLPILCSKYNGCWPELVHNGRNGCVFDPLDAGQTVERLKDAFESREQLPIMGEESRHIVEAYKADGAADAVLKACRIAVNTTPQAGR